jgi:isoamylase
MQSSYDNTGVGGNYNTYNPVAQNLIVDSLAYWRDTMGVDGFRFDLARCWAIPAPWAASTSAVPIATRRSTASCGSCLQRPATGGSGVDLYAEPWAIGGNSYQLGGFPAGWSEWNGSYRDTLRQAQNDLGVATITTGQLATRFAGSSDLFGSRSPWNSPISWLCTMASRSTTCTAVTAPITIRLGPMGPRTAASSTNYSWDQGGAAAAQRAAARVGFALLMLSAGTPLMTGGDEYLRSLRCNNNRLQR